MILIEQDAKRLLMERLDECLKVHADMLDAQNIGSIYELQGLSELHYYLKVEHVFTPAEVEALLSFQDPLDVARWCWEENNHEHSFPICDLLKEIDAEQKFEHFTGEPSAQDKYTLLMKRLGQNYFAYRENLMSRDNKVGCLFADYENRADFSDRNTIIYGHNMRDGSMFALLNRYDEQSYFDTHRQMYLVTPKGGYVMEIFAAFAAKPEESGSETSPWQLSWKDDGAYTTWLTAMKERSAVESDVTVTCSDKVLTLSTCTPGGTGRFLVMGKLVKVDNEI